jgi:hypothetical protein
LIDIRCCFLLDDSACSVWFAEFRLAAMIGGASGEFRNTGSAAASSAWACLVLFVLVFAGVLIGAVSLILIGACFSAKPQSLAGPATPYFGSALAKQGLVPTRAARSWRASEKSTRTAAASSSFRRAEQLPANL